MSPSIRDSPKFFQAGHSSATQCVKPEARELVGDYDRTGYAAPYGFAAMHHEVRILTIRNHRGLGLSLGHSVAAARWV